MSEISEKEYRDMRRILLHLSDKNKELEKELEKYKQENEELKAALGVAREWFDVVQDLNPDYLELRDYVLAEKVYKSCGMKVPNRILKGKRRVSK